MQEVPAPSESFRGLLNLDYFCKSKGAAQRVLANAPMEPDSLKDGLHRPTFHEDGRHAPMEAGKLKVSLRKPTFHEDGLQLLAKFRDNFKDGLHRPTFHDMVYTRNGGRQSQDGLHNPACPEDG